MKEIEPRLTLIDKAKLKIVYQFQPEEELDLGQIDFLKIKIIQMSIMSSTQKNICRYKKIWQKNDGAMCLGIY